MVSLSSQSAEAWMSGVNTSFLLRMRDCNPSSIALFIGSWNAKPLKANEEVNNKRIEQPLPDYSIKRKKKLAHQISIVYTILAN